MALIERGTLHVFARVWFIVFDVAKVLAGAITDIAFPSALKLAVIAVAQDTAARLKVRTPVQVVQVAALVL